LFTRLTCWPARWLRCRLPRRLHRGLNCRLSRRLISWLPRGLAGRLSRRLAARSTRGLTSRFARGLTSGVVDAPRRGDFTVGVSSEKKSASCRLRGKSSNARLTSRAAGIGEIINFALVAFFFSNETEKSASASFARSHTLHILILAKAALGAYSGPRSVGKRPLDAREALCFACKVGHVGPGCAALAISKSLFVGIRANVALLASSGPHFDHVLYFRALVTLRPVHVSIVLAAGTRKTHFFAFTRLNLSRQTFVALLHAHVWLVLARRADLTAGHIDSSCLRSEFACRARNARE